MKKIQILCTAHTASHGTLVEGRVLEVDDKFAAHLVDDCGAAEYVKEVKMVATKVESKPVKPGGANKMNTPKGENKGGAPAVPVAVQTSAQDGDSEGKAV